MGIAPDTKDWTWVLERACPECGFDTRVVSQHEVPSLVRKNAAQWQAVLGPNSPVSIRPRPDRWSTLEYACHVRDVYRLADQRVSLMVDQDDPVFANWDQDATAVADRYNDQDPAVVAVELQDAGATFAERLERLSPQDWIRTGSRSDGARFRVESFARYLIHDPAHHLHDVGLVGVSLDPQP
ncbi:MAG: DinB family protein [Actinomycetota bacterium]|nr:DinB family protein [Actinomycetota bacterium]